MARIKVVPYRQVKPSQTGLGKGKGALGRLGPWKGAAKTPGDKPKYRPGAKALKEIRKYQKSHNLLIPKLPFSRVCLQILKEDIDTSIEQINNDAMECLQVRIIMHILKEYLQFCFHK
jgi:histone H3/H4